MTTDSLTLQSAMELIRAKDKRFDGRFYWGVKTTRIYCRPTCGASPKVENVKIYKSKAEAENAGLRPCLRCRPDISPQSPLWEGTGAVVGRALRLLNQDLTITDVCNKLGLTDRHLRRLFDEHLGASPLEVQISERLHTARNLLDQTQLSMTDIAYASGFRSIRRFNDAFIKKYKRNPSDFRKQKNKTAEGILLRIPVLEPYDWETLFGFFKRHFIYGSEFIDGDCLTRLMKIPEQKALVQIRVSKVSKFLEVEVQNCPAIHLKKVIQKIKAVFDIDHNPFFLVRRQKNWPGVRIPGSFDTFETVISIILGQLVSTEQAQAKVQKLVQMYGEPFADGVVLFPSPKVLLKTDLKPIGITRVRETAIREICKLAIANQLDDQEQIAKIRGIGPWTLEMIKMRCFSETDAYPNTDLIIRRAEESYSIDNQKWSPWRSYLALWIWREYAQKLSNKKVKHVL